MIVIPDASTLLKWVLPPENEPFVEQALSIAVAFAENRIELFTPALWFYEVGNVLAIKHPAIAEQQLVRLQQMGMNEVVPDQAMLRTAIGLVGEKRVSFYDAIYHAIAIAKQGVFVTADEKYLRAVAGEPHAMALSAWQ